MFLPAESELEQLDRQGFFITGPLLSEPELGDLTRALEKQKLETDGRKRGGIGDVIDNLPIVGISAAHPSVRAIVDQVLGVDAFVVRATLFDKTELSNWKVPWHQDVTIAVQKRHEVPGYGPWSVKSGVTHVQPPSEVARANGDSSRSSRRLSREQWSAARDAGNPPAGSHRSESCSRTRRRVSRRLLRGDARPSFGDASSFAACLLAVTASRPPPCPPLRFCNPAIARLTQLAHPKPHLIRHTPTPPATRRQYSHRAASPQFLHAGLGALK